MRSSMSSATAASRFRRYPTTRRYVPRKAGRRSSSSPRTRNASCLPAFVRRCVVLNLNPPGEDRAFIAWLVQRGVHRHLDIAEEARDLAARQVLADRKSAVAAGYPRVGLAEYIDLLTALDELTEADSPDRRSAEQCAWLQRLSAYALVKNAEQPQDRPPVAPAEGETPEP